MTYEALKAAEARGEEIPTVWRWRVAHQRSTAMRRITFEGDDEEYDFPLIAQTADDFVARGFEYMGKHPSL